MRMVRHLFPVLAVLLIPSSGFTRDGKGPSLRPLESGGGAVIVAPDVAPPKVVIVTFNAVSPSRQWTDDKGRKMVGRLLAFSVPEEGQAGAIVVIRDEMIRFLRSGAEKPVDFPLVSLSAEDQTYIRGIAKATAKAAQQAAQPVAKPVVPE